jgi:serine/threonine protein phosphatase PrpC
VEVSPVSNSASTSEMTTPRLYLASDMTDVDEVAVCGGLAVVSSRRSPVKETPNEDAAAVIPVDGQCGLLVVADGVGGVRSGDMASRLAVESLRDAVTDSSPGDEFLLRAAIVNGIEEANRRIMDTGVGAATTLAVLEVSGCHVRPYHVGDSTIVLVGGRGKLKWQTVPHSPVGFAIEAGILDEEEAMHHQDRHIVSNVVGSAEMRIEIGPEVRLAPRDTVVLASDGLLDNLTIDEIVARVRKGPLDKAVRRLAADSRRRMTCPEEGQPNKPDDTTIVAYRQVRVSPSSRESKNAPGVHVEA